MFEPGNGFIGTTGFFLKACRHIRHDGRAAARVLGLPVRVRGHVLDDHVGRDGRPLRLRRRHHLQRRRHRVPIRSSDTGPGARRLARDGAAVPDFAGSTVVHTIGGAISLMGGDRARSAARARLPARRRWSDAAANIILGAVGGLILWFGWYGFNPGSTLSALDAQGIGRVSFNTTMAACSAGLAALCYAYARVGKWDLGLTVNGFLAGLVAITCPCYWVSPTGAFFIGIVAGFVVIWATDALEYLRIDDPIGAVPVHMVCGIWGTLSLGLFATGAYGVPTPTGVDVSLSQRSLLRRRVAQLMSQVIGSGAITIATLVSAAADVCGKSDGHAPHFGRGRDGRTRSARARHAGVSGIRDPRRFRLAASCDARQIRDVMKLIKAIVRPNKVDEVKDALGKLNVSGVTVTEVRGHGKQKGHTAIYRGQEYAVSLLPKMELEVVVPDDIVDEAVKAVIEAARTGEIGDGRVFVFPVEQSYRIRTGELDRE